jgi:hypothetical protein
MKLQSLYFILCATCLACNSNDPADTAATQATFETDTATKPTSTPDSLYEIVPGDRIGRTYIGQRVDEATKDLGQPAWGDAAMGKAWGTWYGKGTDSLQHQLSIYSTRDTLDGQETMLVQQVRVTSPSFVTANGIHTGSLISEIRQFFPGISAVGYYPDQQQQRVYIYDDAAQGIAFDIALPDSTCTAIAVHRKGENVAATYLPLHPGLVTLGSTP